MTPAQLVTLIREHNRRHAEKPKRAPRGALGGAITIRPKGGRGA